MINHHFSGFRPATFLVTLLGALGLAALPLKAAVFYWDSDGNATNDNPALGTNLGGSGTWDAATASWFSSASGTDAAWPNLGTDTAIFYGTAGTVTIAAGGINTGALQFLTTSYTLTGAPVTLGAAGANVFVGSSVAATISAVIDGANGLGVYGPGTLNISAVNLYTGNTSLSNGATLNLDFTANTTSLIQSTSSLVLNSGTLKLSGVSGATDSQTFASTSVAGGGVITLTQNSAASLTVALGGITQSSGGSLNFSVAPLTSGIIATTTNTNVSGLLGTWASVGSGTSGLNYATVNGSGQIVAYAGATTAATAANLTDTTGTVNYNLSAATGTMAATFSANTIRYTGSALQTTPGSSFTVNGLMNSGTGLWTIGTTTVTIGANRELEVITGTNGITISGTIQNNGGGASSLTYSGTGTLTLSKANTYTGTTTVNSGTLTLGIAAALNSASSVVVNGGTMGQSTFAQTVASVTLKNGTISGTTGLLTSTAAFDLQSGTVSAAMAGSAGLNKTTAGTVTLSQTTAGTLTGAINVKAGTLVMGGTAVAFAAANTITLGDSSGSADARLAVSNTNATYANPIVLNSGTTGNLSIGNQGTTAISFTNANTISGTNNLIIASTSTGGLTLANVANTGTVTNSGSGTGTTTITLLGAGVTALNQTGASALTLTPAWLASQLGSTITNSGTGLFTLTGGVSGGTNLVFNANGTGGISVASTSNSGTITVSGTGTGTTTLTTLGAGVTALNLTGSGALTLTPAWLASQLGSTITNNGTGLLTLTGGITGGTNLVFNANGTGGITVTGAMTSSGTITSSGTGTGNVTLTAAIPSTITDLVQNSSGTLTLTSGANAYTGTTTVTSGILSFASTPAVTTSSGLGNSTSNIVLGGATTMGTLVYTGSAGTLSRNFTINAGGGEIDSTTATLTINPGGVLTAGTLTINPGGNLTFGGANNITLGGATANVALISGTNALNKVGTGTLTLSMLGGFAPIQSAMPINIMAGTLSLVSTNAVTTAELGTGLITITPGATLTANFGGATTTTLANAITIAAASGTANITVTSGAFQNATGAITFAAGSTAATILKLNNSNGTAATLNLGGTVTGTGTIQLNPSSGGAPITLSGAQNQTGSISNVGSSTSTSTLSGTIGAGITAISQAGANPFTVSSAVPLSATLNTFNSTGAGLWTFSGGISGTQALTLNANANGNITVSTGAVSITGSITNSGTGGGVTTISVGLGSTITNILQSGAGTQLVLSGTNTYTGTTTVTAGIMDFTTTLAIPGYSTSPATAFGRISVASGAILVLPYGGVSSVTAADWANLLNGTYNVLSAGASLGLDTTNTLSFPATLGFTLADAGGTIGALNFTKSGANSLNVGAANTYTGTTSIVNGTLIASIINSVVGGTASSSLGAPVTVANGTINLGFGTTTGILSYIGTGETTDRVFNLAGTTGSGGIDNSGTGLLTISSPITFTGTGAKTLTFSGSGNILVNSAITGSISTGPSPLTIAKTGTGTLTLTGANTATTLTIAGGILDTGSTGLTLSNAGGSTIAATGNATINGKIILSGSTSALAGGDIGANGNTLTINASIVQGIAGIAVDFNPGAAGGMVILNGANNWSGQTNINSALIIQVASLNTFAAVTANSITTNPQTTSNLGAPSSLANGIVAFTGGTLKYIGTGENTDRGLALNGGNGVVDQSGTGILYFAGGVTQQGTAGARTLTFQGSTAGTGQINGVIGQNSTTNTTSIIKAGTGTWTFSGANTYTGSTTVNGGNLILSQGAGTGTLSNTAVTINSGGTLSPLGGTAGYTIGNTATAAAGGRLTLNAGGTLNLGDGVINPLILVQNSTFTGNAATFAGGAINFDIGTSTVDLIDVRLNNVTGTGQATSSGLNAISILPTTGTATLTPGNYTLISANAAGSTLSNSNFYLASSNLNVGGTLYQLSLSGTTGTEVLTIAVNSGAALTPYSAFWNGTTNSSWAYQPGGNGTATNWSASANGRPDTFALPGSQTNVTFVTNTATNLTSTLDQNFVINSLTFAGTASTIASGTGANTLTINAAALNGSIAGNGITVIAGAGASVISADVILGSSQTWTSNSTNVLTVSGAVGDGGSIFNLSTAGTGTIFLSGTASTYSGVTTIGAGSTLRVGTFANGGLVSSIGQSSSSATNLVISGTLLYNGAAATSDRSFTINAGATAIIDVAGTSSLTLAGATGAVTTGILTKTDTGTLILTGAQTYTGNTVVNGGTLTISGTGSLTGLTASTKLTIAPTAGNTAVVNYSSTGTSTLFAITGASVAGTASVLNQTAGTINLSANTTTNTQSVVGGVGAYGFYNISGGTLRNSTGTTGGSRFTVTNSGGTAPITSGMTGAGVVTGVIYVTGTGVIDHTNAEWWLSYGFGEITVADSGKIDHTGSNNPFAIFMDTAVTGGSYGVLNLAGTGAQVLTGNTKGLQFGNNTTNGTGNSGFVNLAAGTLSTGVNAATSLNAAGANSIYFNFAGGTLRATANLTQFTPTSNAAATVINTIYGAINNNAGALTGSSAPSFTGGLTIDTNTFTVTVPTAMPLLGATGYRVTQADLTVTGGSGYVGAPAVLFSKPASATGVPAAGYALMDGDTVVGIVITDPGVYAAGETPVITLVGGGATVAATVTSAALTTANSNTGGLTKVGAGNLLMSGTGNTFGGAVDIKGGTLTVTSITNGGAASSTLGTSSSAASNLLLDGGVLSYTGTVAGSTDRSFTLAATSGGLDASGTTAGTFTLTSTGAIGVASSLGAANLTLQGSGTGTAGAGSLAALITDGTGTQVSLTKNGTGTWTLTNGASTYTGATTLNGGILSVAVLSAGGSASSIGAASTAAANLVFSGGTLLYTGSGSTTDRNYTFGNATTAAGGTIDSEGTGALVITGGMTGVNAVAGTQVLTLTAGAATGNNTIYGIADSNTGLGALTGVTKTGAGLWIIGGSSSYSGATTLTTGTLQYAGGSALQGATAIGMATGTILQIRDDASTITHTSNNITISSAGTVTIDVGGNGGATTGSTVAFGALNNGTAANALASVFNFTGSNGYRQSFSSLSLAGSTGANTTLNPTTTSVTITGNVTNQMTSATAHYDTLFLDGTSTGNAINGVISDSSVYVSVGNGDTRITKQNSSTWTLGGANTYTGATAINAGTLALSSTGSLGNTAITVANGAIFAPTPGSGSTSVGTSGAGALGATLTINANGTLSMVDGAIGTFYLNTNTSFASAALTLTSGNLNLDLSSAGIDQIVVAGNSVASVITGTNTISITTVGTSLTPGTYALLTAPGIVAGNTLFKFDNGTTSTSMTVGLLSYQLTLTSVAGIEQIVVGAGVGSFTWTGQTNGTGATNSVWTAAASGNNNFADLSPAVADYSEGSAVTFQDLNLISGVNVINGTVIVDAAGVNPSAVTVNNSAVNYTFQNAGGTVGITGSTGLTKTGTGTLTLLGRNTYTGPTAINGGTVVLAVAEGGGSGPLGTGGVISFGGGTLQFTSVNTFDYSSRFSSAAGEQVVIDTNGQNVTFATAMVSPGGTLTKNGLGKLTLSAVNTFTGATTINAGTLTVTGASSSQGAMGSATITVNAGAVLDLTNNDTLGYTSGRNALTINGGTVQNNATGKRNTLINSVTMVGGLLSGTSLGDANSGAFSLNNSTAAVIATSDASGNAATISANVSTQTVAVFQVTRGSAVAAGAPDLIISGAITPYGASGPNGITIKGTGIATLSGANTYTGTTTLASGTLIIGANNTIKTTNQLTFGTAASANVGALQLNSFSQTLGTILVTSNTTTANTISIASGQTLTTGTLTMGYDATTGTGATNSNLTVSGAGTFAISGATTVSVSVNQAATNAAYYSQATLDLTGVASFTATVSTFNVGVGTSTTGNGTVLLSNTANTITATTLQVGHSGGNNANGTSLLQFGTGTNVINATTINLGYSKASANVGFASHTAGSAGTLTIAGLAGGTSTSNITIASNNGTGTAAIDTVVFDVTGHVVTIQAGSLQIGNGNNALTGGANGTLSFDAGAVSALNTSIGLKAGTGGTGAGIGVLNIGGGTFTVKTGGSLVLATNTAATGSATGSVNITGSGTLSSNADITKGGGTSTTASLTLNGATALLDMSGGGAAVHNIGSATAVLNSFTFTNGTLRNFGIIYGGITLAGTGQRVFDETGSFSGQVNGVITGTGVGIDKTGTGTITLLGASTFTGNIDIDGGTLVASLGNNTLNPTSSALGNMQVSRSINVNNGGTLQFSSSDTFGSGASAVVATLVINAGGTVTNDATGEFNTLGAVQMNGGTLTGVLGGGSAQAQMYSLKGTVTVGGSAASTISGPAAGGSTYGGYHLAANTTFNVANATGDSGSDLVVSGALIDQASTLAAGGLTKSGAGTMTVTSTSTYSGVTTVSGGILQVGTNATSATASIGSGSGAVNVGNGATLAGTGTVGGGTSTTTISSGAVLMPGDSTAAGVLTNGALNIGGSLTVAAGGQIQLQIDSPTVSGSLSGFQDYVQTHAGATALDYLNDPANSSALSTWNAAPASGSNNYDYLNVGGTLTLGHAAHEVTVTFNNYATVSYGDVFNLLDWTTLTGADASALAGGFNVATDLDLSALGAGLAWDTSAFTRYGIIVVAPEPARAALLLLGLTGLLLRRRRRA